MKGRSRTLRGSWALRGCVGLAMGLLLAWPVLTRGEPDPGRVAFQSARPDYAWSFPRDHGHHPGYRIEWWYYTGHLRAVSGRRFGYQFTIFKVETAPWRPGDVYPPVLFIAHAALSDEAGKRLVYHETFQRLFPGMAGPLADGAPGEIGLFVEDDRLRIDRGGRRHRLDFGTERFRLSLELETRLGPILHGRRGYSPKGPEVDNASQYYSLVDLAGRGRLTLDGEPVALEGVTGWMDHEFSSNFLTDGQAGWDWFWFALDNGVRLMLFRVRAAAGDGDDYYSGTVVEPDGTTRALDAREIKLVAEKTWRSPETKAAYPVRYRLEVGRHRLTSEAWFEAHELNTRVAGMNYWEGPVDVRGTWDGLSVRGQGFVEMTGYAEPVGKKF